MYRIKFKVVHLCAAIALCCVIAALEAARRERIRRFDLATACEQKAANLREEQARILEHLKLNPEERNFKGGPFERYYGQVTRGKRPILWTQDDVDDLQKQIDIQELCFKKYIYYAKYPWIELPN